MRMRHFRYGSGYGTKVMMTKNSKNWQVKKFNFYFNNCNLFTLSLSWRSSKLQEKPLAFKTAVVWLIQLRLQGTWAVPKPIRWTDGASEQKKYLQSFKSQDGCRECKECNLCFRRWLFVQDNCPLCSASILHNKWVIFAISNRQRKICSVCS